MAVVRAARVLAEAASRVLLAAVVRVRRAVVLDGDFVAVVREVDRLRLVDAVERLRDVELEAVDLRVAGLRVVVDFLVVLLLLWLVVAIRVLNPLGC